MAKKTAHHLGIVMMVNVKPLSNTIMCWTRTDGAHPILLRQQGIVFLKANAISREAIEMAFSFSKGSKVLGL